MATYGAAEVNSVFNMQFFPRLLVAGVLLLLVMVMVACQGLSSANPSTSTGGSTPLPATGTLASGFYVATNGDDKNPGTLSQPFATFSKAQQAMRASSSVKTTYIRAGTYKPAPVTASCLNGRRVVAPQVS